MQGTVPNQVGQPKRTPRQLEASSMVYAEYAGLNQQLRTQSKHHCNPQRTLRLSMLLRVSPASAARHPSSRPSSRFWARPSSCHSHADQARSPWGPSSCPCACPCPAAAARSCGRRAAKKCTEHSRVEVRAAPAGELGARAARAAWARAVPLAAGPAGKQNAWSGFFSALFTQYLCNFQQ
jgi:hypothetical protein